MELNLRRSDYSTHAAATGADALAAIRGGFVGCILLDLSLPDYQGLDLFHEIRRLNDSLPIIIVTAHGTIALAIEATRLGAFDFLAKTDAFLERVHVSTKNAFAQLELHTRLAQLSSELHSRYQFDQVIAVSDEMKKVFDMLGHAIDSRVTVLIQGESGTGKELVARALHYNGNRKAGPFVPVNCAGIPDTLLESELFGYEKGAFTGAVARKIGKFEVANGGTLFLDEIGEMPLLLQAKLLRALQEREIERLGGTRPIKLDLRYVCATNRDLQAEVRAGRFREDLYYRLAVFPIQLPRLADRYGDVPVLAAHFLQRAAKEEGKAITGFDSDTLAILMDYAYPGNVRELENIISHAVVIASGTRIKATDLPASLRGESASGATPRRGPRRLDHLLADAVQTADEIPTMEEVEARIIERAVELCQGNLVQAAKRLGISRATIYRRIGKLNLKRA